MPSEEHACVFCEASYPSLRALVFHLVGEHQRCNLAYVKEFRVFPRGAIQCFCGERFSENRGSNPLFVDWHFYPEQNSFQAHLLREGGLAKHLLDCQNEALMAKIAEAREEPGFLWGKAPQGRWMGDAKIVENLADLYQDYKKAIKDVL
jgi:hypothetical protein